MKVKIKNIGNETTTFRYYLVNMVEKLEPDDEVIIDTKDSESTNYYLTLLDDNLLITSEEDDTEPDEGGDDQPSNKVIIQIVYNNVIPGRETETYELDNGQTFIFPSIDDQEVDTEGHTGQVLRYHNPLYSLYEPGQGVGFSSEEPIVFNLIWVTLYDIEYNYNSIIDKENEHITVSSIDEINLPYVEYDNLTENQRLVWVDEDLVSYENGQLITPNKNKTFTLNIME